MREKLFSVTLADCEVQAFRPGGNGGQKVDKTSSAIRIIHYPSGARGESRESRSQFQNKKAAFNRMADTPLFRSWVAQMTGRIKTDAQIEAEVDKSLAENKNVKTEIKRDGKWIENDELE